MVLILFLSHVLDEKLPTFVSVFVGVVAAAFFGRPGNLPCRQTDHEIWTGSTISRTWLALRTQFAWARTYRIAPRSSVSGNLLHRGHNCRLASAARQPRRRTAENDPSFRRPHSPRLETAREQRHFPLQPRNYGPGCVHSQTGKWTGRGFYIPARGTGRFRQSGSGFLFRVESEWQGDHVRAREGPESRHLRPVDL
jgi:hypothetical protein